MWWCVKPGRPGVRINLVWSLLASCFIVTPPVLGDSSDPILQYRPAFARSMPVQILLTGVIFALLSILLIQLLFTARYHWRLSPGNYVLQMCGVFTLGTSTVAAMYKILYSTAEQSRTWPYMLPYIAVDIPPLLNGDNGNDWWETWELAAWSLMNGTTSALIQIVHIHFLTLLFPNKTVKALIFILLVPLAVVHGIVQVLSIWKEASLTRMAHFVSNICSATLALLFTSLQLLWAFFVKRRSAWRTEGGTAAFGVAATSLSILMTVLTFVYIPNKDQYEWYPELVHAVMMWQSYLGWWWWVGTGLYVDVIVKKDEQDSGKTRKKGKRTYNRAGSANGSTDASQPLVRSSMIEFLSQSNRSLRRRTNAGPGRRDAVIMRQVKLKTD